MGSSRARRQLIGRAGAIAADAMLGVASDGLDLARRHARLV